MSTPAPSRLAALRAAIAGPSPRPRSGDEAPQHPPVGEHAFEDAGIGMGLIDASMTWVRVNPALAASFGATPQTLVGRSIMERIPAVGRRVVQGLIEDIAAGSRRIDPTDITVLTPNGTQREMLIAGDVIHQDTDAPQLFLQVRDVTTQRRSERFSVVVSELSTLALTSSDISGFLQSLAAETQAALHAPFVVSVLAGDGGPGFRVLAPPATIRPELREALSQGGHPINRVMRTASLATWHDLDPGLGPIPEALIAAELETVTIFPVVPSMGPPAALCIGYETARSSMATDELRFLESIANLAASAIERSRREALSHHEALHDALTGLANRTLLNAHVVHAIQGASRSGACVGAVLIDLDRFKNVNDTLGHIAGDALLVQVAGRLEELTRGGDLVARLGGDEFVVIFDDPENAAALEQFAERLVEAFDQPFDVDGRELFVGSSVGIALASADDASAESLLRDADVAMYRAKAAGGGQHAVFDEELRAELVARVDTERDLRHAVDRGELRLALQPQINLSEGRVSFEALVRWARPGVGIVPPGHFVQVAEDTGLIVPLGTWVLRESLAWIARAETVHGFMPTVSVNVSGRQLTDELPQIVADALRDTGVPAAYLCLELTESMLIADHRATAVLTELRNMGIALSLDDFGTGWSSLAALQRHPVDELKLDRSMVTALGVDETSAAITRAAVEMALALGLTVVAEGIEDEAQLAAVRDLGCQIAQGFLFSRPLPPEEASAYLTSQSWTKYLLPASRAA